MKNVVFIMSHFGSGSFDLVRMMNRNPRITIENSGARYYHPDDLEWLFSKEHKLKNAAAIYGDHILLNANFACDALLKAYKFIYVIRSAKMALNRIVTQSKFSEKNTLSYYAFRLTRISEMAKATPGAVLLTWEDLTSATGLPLIEEYLGLKTQLEPTIDEFVQDETQTQCNLPSELIQQGQEAYERYLYYLKQLDLRSNL